MSGTPARRIGFVSVSISVLLCLPVWVIAQTVASVDDVSESVEFRGYYVDGNADVPIDELEALANAHPDIGFVALSSEPERGADLYADAILASIDDPDTVIVLTPAEATAVSAVYDDETLGDALDSVLEDGAESYLADFDEFAVFLAEEGDGLPVAPIVVVGGAGVVGYLWWRRRRRVEAAAVAPLDEARAEIRAQLKVIADEILEFSDRPNQESEPEAVDHFRRASAAYDEAEERLAAATTLDELEDLSDDLDVARWELAAAEAIVTGGEIPERPPDAAPEPCFFDPTHGPGVESATLETATGTRIVRVCRADAERLRKGEQPAPRTIDVGGRPTPAPKAPRTHGGGGMDWLDAFTILVGGMGRPMGYRWPRGGGLGRSPRMRIPSGSRSTPRSRTTSRSGSRSGGRTRTRPASRSKGRARRRRR